MHFLILLCEIRSVLGVLGGVPGRDDLLAIRSEDLEHRFLIIALRRGCERLRRFFRRGKRLLALLLRHRARGDATRQNDNKRGDFP
jgi:hypothetical protein